MKSEVPEVEIFQKLKIEGFFVIFYFFSERVDFWPMTSIIKVVCRR